MATSEMNIPFAATAGLLILWGTGRFDSDVTFLSVIFVASYVLASSLATGEEFGSTITLRELDYFSPYFHGDQRPLSYFLAMTFCFACGAVGSTVFAFSPFAGTLLYSTVVSALFRDVSMTADARSALWTCVILAGALSEHIFRLNIAAGIFAVVCLDRQVRFGGHGTQEAAALLTGMMLLALHDWTVRFLLEPFRVLIRAGFLGMTAFVMVDSAMELAALPAMRQAGTNGGKDRRFISLSWADCMQAASDGAPLSFATFPSRLAVAAPALSCLFCAACFFRMLRMNRKLLDWLRWQQLIGVGLGTGLGLKLWTLYGSLANFDATSPVALCWVFTALLLAASSIFSSSPLIVPSSSFEGTLEPPSSGSASVWHATYWRGGETDSRTGSKTKKSEGNSGSSTTTPYPTLLLGSFSATYPEVYDIAIQLEDAHFSLESALAKAKRYSSSNRNSFEKAKQLFACNSLVNSLVKLTEDLTGKLQERVALVERQGSVFARIDGNDPSSSSMSQKAKQRAIHLNQDLMAIQSYAEQLKRELAKRDEDTLNVLEQTFNEAKERMATVSAAKNGDASHERELSKKRELDELDQMCEAIMKRIKHRKKKELEEQQQQQQATTPAPPSSGVPTPSMDESFNVNLPILAPGQAVLYPSSPDGVGRDAGSTPSKTSPSSRARSRFFLFRSKKSGTSASSSPIAAAAAQTEIEASDRQSASSGGRSASSSRKWGLFGRSSKKAASPPPATNGS